MPFSLTGIQLRHITIPYANDKSIRVTSMWYVELAEIQYVERKVVKKSSFLWNMSTCS
jgi:hypothetical protein